ncbi:hypothetical protein DYH09_25440 [bacterium CPR1]|nr:hypothetical protein [bacterium CPR1]
MVMLTTVLLAVPPIQPGVGVGKVKLGVTLADIEAALGKTDQVESSPNDPESKFYKYPRFGVVVFVGSSGKVIGVNVTSSQYRTPEGLGVGSSRAQVEQAYGTGLARGTGNVSYAQKGLAFSFHQDKVTHVFVFKPEEQRPFLGDRQIVPGQRVGDLKLGAPCAPVRQAWGAPPRTTPLSGIPGEIWNYTEQGVGVLASEGKIKAVIVTSGDFISRQGVQVGSSLKEVEKEFGSGYQKSTDFYFYTRKGIGFQVLGGRVSEIRVVAPGK